MIDGNYSSSNDEEDNDTKLEEPPVEEDIVQSQGCFNENGLTKSPQIELQRLSQQQQYSPHDAVQIDQEFNYYQYLKRTQPHNYNVNTTNNSYKIQKNHHQLYHNEILHHIQHQILYKMLYMILNVNIK